MVDVKGRWALITGASRGIGYLAALEMAKRGCNLLVQARSEANLAKVVEETKKLGVEAIPFGVDLASAEEVEAMLAKIDELGMTVDIILNNAGIQIAYRTDYLTTPVSDYMESYKINTVAPAMICYHFLPKMIERDFGRIVNTTSGIALDPQQAGYSASKAALDKITIDIGSKLEGTGVTINLTDPGWCRTDLGGPNAPNAPESALPGVIVGAFIEDGHSGRYLGAGRYYGMTLEEAVEYTQKNIPDPYHR